MRVVVNAWFGVAPSFVALDVLIRGSRDRGNSPSRTVAEEGSGQVGGAAMDDVG